VALKVLTFIVSPRIVLRSLQGENAPARIDSQEIDHASNEATIVAVVLAEDDRL
jgi:hypothetical protein